VAATILRSSKREGGVYGISLFVFASGPCYLKLQKGEDMERERDEPAGAAEEDAGGMTEAEIDYNVMESFPASDPPSWTLGVEEHEKSHQDIEGAKPSIHDPSYQNEHITPEE
jgi:hypothetical protein